MSKKKSSLGGVFASAFRAATGTMNAVAELAEGTEAGARTLSGMARRNEQTVNINGNIDLAESMRSLADRAKEAKLSTKDLERLKNLGLEIA